MHFEMSWKIFEVLVIRQCLSVVTLIELSTATLRVFLPAPIIVINNGTSSKIFASLTFRKFLNMISAFVELLDFRRTNL